MGKLLVLPVMVSKKSRIVEEDTDDESGAGGEHSEFGKKRKSAEDCHDVIPQIKRQNSCSFSIASFGLGSRPPSVAGSFDSRSSSHVSTASSGASSFSISYAISRSHVK